MIDRYIPIILTGCLLFLQLSLFTGNYFFIAPFLPLAILAAWYLYQSPQTGILALLFIIPFEGLFKEYGSFTGAKLIGFGLILIAFVRLLLKKSSLETFRTPLLIPLFFFMTFFLFSSVLSDYSGPAAQALRQQLTALAIFFVTLLFGSLINGHHLARTVVSSITITASIAILSSNEITEGRATGLLSDPNYFALMLVIAIPLAIYLLIYEKTVSVRIIWGIALLILMLAFQKTMSRSGLLVLLVVLILVLYNFKYLFARLNLSQLTLSVCSLFLLICISIAMLPSEYQERILSLSSISSGVQANNDRSLSRRTAYLIVGADAFKEEPILGSGPGSFPKKYAQSGFSSAYSLSKENPEIYRRAHNTYLETLAENGVLGLLSLLSLIGVGLMQFIKAKKLELEKGNLEGSNRVALVGISFVSIIFFFLFLSVPTNKYFWIYLALSSTLLLQADKTAK